MKSYGKHSVSWSDAFAVAWQTKTKSLTQGPKIQEFEEKIAQYVGAKYAVAVSSGTAGLHLALLALELPSGSEVVTSPISFVASSNSAIYAGLVPIFVDIDPKSLNISTLQIDEYLKTSSDVKVLMPVHMAGAPCDMEEISRLASQSGLAVVEDAAHALGSRHTDGSLVGSCSKSDMTVFSFHPVKSMTTGEGGLITTNNYDYYRRLLRLRSHGITQLDDPLLDPIRGFTNHIKNPWYHEMQTLGYHYRLTEIQAALGISQLKKLDSFICRRRELAAAYDILLSHSENVRPTQKEYRSKSAHHLYIVQINFSNIEVSRAELMNKLKNLGIGTQVHYKPIPIQPYYVANSYQKSSIPEAMNYYAQCLSLPIYPGLTSRQQKKIVSTLEELLN